jgi:histidyl-tRNA synthetase
MAQKPSLPKGTRDFTPQEVVKRNYIVNTIREQFELFGYAPIETPSFENYDTLMGKYGEEGDRLIFKILNSGDYLKKANQEALEIKDSQKLTPSISEKALRYDLTVPFARYVVQHQNEIDFPFKRYQIQPVWRADRPQKGRFREFYQCDADVVGSTSLFQEIELIQLYDRVFSKLGLQGVTIKLNNRKILSGIAEVIGASDKLIDFTVALDKLDKIGVEKVIEEMIAKGISKEAVRMADPLFKLSGSSTEQLNLLKEFLLPSKIGSEGVEELRFILNGLESTPLKTANVTIEVTLARGLNYYTGAIIEVGAPKSVSMGSIGGGGRYDDLTSIFGLKNVGGVGISFGLDRIYLVLEELNLFPKTIASGPKVLFINFGDNEALASSKLIGLMRDSGVSCELYPNAAKMQKQMKYANNKNVAHVVMIGESELESESFVAKNMETGEQLTYSVKEIEKFIDSLA